MNDWVKTYTQILPIPQMMREIWPRRKFIEQPVRFFTHVASIIIMLATSAVAFSYLV